MKKTVTFKKTLALRRQYCFYFQSIQKNEKEKNLL